MIADRVKRVARAGNSEPSLTVGLVPRAASGLASRSASAGAIQQTDLEDSERRALLFRLVDELAEDQGRVLVMRFAGEQSIREIAETLQRSEGAVKQLQFRALENLRAKLGRHEGWVMTEVALTEQLDQAIEAMLRNPEASSQAASPAIA